MLQRSFLLTLFSLFWSCCTLLDGGVSDPQTHLLTFGCTPFDQFVISDLSIFNENLNATFRDLRGQIRDQSKHFGTVQEGSGGSPVYTLFQCRNYLSVADCVACFDVAAVQIRSCPAGAPGGHVVYDGCFRRYDASPFFDRPTDTFNAALCGNKTTEEATAFTSAVQKLLMNLQKETSTIPGFLAAMKTHVPNTGPTIHTFVQCTETITQSGCLNCLNVGYKNMQTCLPTSDGRAFDQGCFLRYSTTSFFPDNYQIIDVTPMDKQGSINKGAIIGGAVAGSVILALIVLAFFLWAKPPKNPKRVPGGGDTTGASKLKGPVNYSYKDLKLSTKNFNADNKLGQGGFGTVYEGTLKNGKVVAVKKLTLRHSTKVEDEFESEVKLISNVHHRNLVRLLGYCSKDNTRILVYEYMKNTSLDKFLFEIISGRKSEELNINGEAEGEFLLQKAWKLYERGRHLELVDNTLDPNDCDIEEVKKIIEIGLLCTQASPTIRPTISEVVVLLQNKGLF
ncbi:cysteine-rich receptor-like protein kinase 42 isoform X1 [Prosopis cineraria]|uniref:cysteine-rich receptor-like protein kinase 42 isoform X1 n=1 Tax=Prosopis cineraria TaxID=364024 RepID=UPI00240EEF3C|nr:cysteine-rich receptor-like protein kinase 42 isoform X1 [Prosopis cineraria]